MSCVKSSGTDDPLRNLGDVYQTRTHFNSQDLQSENAGRAMQSLGPSGGMVDAGDSKSPAARCAGSSPASGTIFLLITISNNDKLNIAIMARLEFR